MKSSSHDPTSEFMSQEAEEEGRVCCCCCHDEKCRKFCWCRYLEISILPWIHADHTPPADMTDHTPPADMIDHTPPADMIDHTPSNNRQIPLDIITDCLWNIDSSNPTDVKIVIDATHAI